MKSDVFKTELNFIKDNRIKESTKIILELLPNYFYEIPASSTGKYHPEFSLGTGGLVRHVKVAVRFAKELLDNPYEKIINLLINKGYNLNDISIKIGTRLASRVIDSSIKVEFKGRDKRSWGV